MQYQHRIQPTADETATLKIYRVLYTNAQSIFSKINDLNVTAAEEEPDLILLTETWCGPNTTNAELSIAGYQLETDLRRDRTDTAAGIGGGLIVYSKCGTTLRKTDRFKDNDFNQFVEFELIAEKPINFIVIYRPPNSGNENIAKLCKILENLSMNTVVVGDFNLPEVDWDGEQSGARGRPVLEAVMSNQLSQLVNFATHIKGNLLDLVITNCPHKILSVQESGRLGRSDHEMIKLEILNNEQEKRIPKKFLDWKKCDYNAMREFLTGYRWRMDGTAETDWMEFKTVIERLVECFVPVRIARSKHRPKWLTADLVKLIRRKKAAWKKAKFYNGGPEMENYKMLEKEAAKKIKQAKKKFEKDMAFSNDKNRKNFSNYIKSKTKSRTTIGPLKTAEGSITANKTEMANTLNGFFASVFTAENMTNIPVKQRETNAEITTVEFKSELILKKLAGLRPDSAPGPDKISPRILKELRFELVEPLRKLFTKSMQTCTVPKDWKTAVVTPIFKKGAKSDPGNYRPVSLTSVPCKIMEGVIKEHMMEHLTKNKLISDSQHGFVAGRSCTTNLLTFQEEITKYLDDGIPVDVFYLDFAKAFDKVPHGRLLIKLESKGITGELKAWVGEWLSGRTQKVMVDGEMSAEEDVKSGVPQGTVMGPPLFTVYIDDIDFYAQLVRLFVKFADDGKGMKEIRSRKDAEEMQAALNSLFEWATLWGMAFNVDKCKVMHMGRNNPGYDYYINGTKLKVVNDETDVGVIIQNNMKPAKQCQKAANTAAAVLKTVQRNFHFRDKNVFVRLYKQYVRPHLEFAIPAWSPWQENDKQILEAVQIKAVKWVTGLVGDTYEERCKELGLQTLETRRWEQDMTQTFKILHGIGNIDESRFFTRIGDRNFARTRLAAGAKNLEGRRARTEIRRHCFSSRVVGGWNSLPDEVKSVETVPAFKNGIKKFIENGGRP
jgi:hypothetical protein